VGHVRLYGPVRLGGWSVAFMTRLRGSDNARARQILDWRPGYPSWRDGFPAELTRRPPVPTLQKGTS
jgi:hypothetical protein